MTQIKIVSASQISSCWRLLIWHIKIRAWLWRDLSRDASHPVATHLRRQMSGARYLPVLRLSLAFGCLLLVFLAYAYIVIDHLIVWLLPVWLMLFSAPYCALWIVRIVPLMSRQSVLGVLDEISVIPPGPVFIYLTICKVVLNRDDAVVWLGLLRRVLAGLVLLVLLATLCIALSLMADSSPLELAGILFDLVLSAALIWLEHSQSTVLACLIALEVSNRVGGNVDKSSVALTIFVLAQMICYAVVLTIVAVFDHFSLGAALLIFLFLREFLVAVLWRLILAGANEERGYLAAIEWQAAAAMSDDLAEHRPGRARGFDKRG